VESLGILGGALSVTLNLFQIKHVVLPPKINQTKPPTTIFILKWQKPIHHTRKTNVWLTYTARNVGVKEKE